MKNRSEESEIKPGKKGEIGREWERKKETIDFLNGIKHKRLKLEEYFSFSL